MGRLLANWQVRHALRAESPSQNHIGTLPAQETGAGLLLTLRLCESRGVTAAQPSEAHQKESAARAQRGSKTRPRGITIRPFPDRRGVASRIACGVGLVGASSASSAQVMASRTHAAFVALARLAAASTLRCSSSGARALNDLLPRAGTNPSVPLAGNQRASLAGVVTYLIHPPRTI
jgi:hypothetical protein